MPPGVDRPSGQKEKSQVSLLRRCVKHAETGQLLRQSGPHPGVHAGLSPYKWQGRENQGERKVRLDPSAMKGITGTTDVLMWPLGEGFIVLCTILEILLQI